MNLVLTEAEQQLERSLTRWRGSTAVSIGMFSLVGTDPHTVVYPTRYLELTAFLSGAARRPNIIRAPARTLRADILEVVAELAWHAGKADVRGRCLPHQEIRSGFRLYGQRSMCSRTATIDEGYMAVSFFGLLHELGHGQRLPAHLVESGLLATDTIRDAVGSHLDSWDIAAQLGVGCSASRDRGRPSHPLNPASLRAELHPPGPVRGVGAAPSHRRHQATSCDR